MSDPLVLDVFLDDIYVGELRHDPDRGGARFRMDRTYRAAPNRPVLGQIFEDNLEREYTVRHGVPVWFANLLPEGPLRTLIADRAGVHPTREFFLLAHLGDDLPGAVQVRPAAGEAVRAAGGVGGLGEPDRIDVDYGTNGQEEAFKFSLAGVQLKLSVLLDQRGVTIPVVGEHGNFIAKLPDQRHQGVPENEFAMMTWAERSGLLVPEFFLTEVRAIGRLPAGLADPAEAAFVIRRFDRSPEGRIHIEDFAQVEGRPPTTKGKYGGANYETVARVVYELGGSDDLKEMIRRLVAMVAMGNGDAHLKNWSLIYADRRRARLAPAYDLVSTSTYVPQEETLALNLARSKRFQDVDLESFRRLAAKLGLPDDALDETVAGTVERLQRSWSEVIRETPVPALVERDVTDRLKTLPLLQL